MIYAIIKQNPVGGVEIEDIAQDSRLGLCAAWYRYNRGQDIQNCEGLATRITKCVCIAHIHRAEKDRLIKTIAPDAVRQLHVRLRAYEFESCEVDTRDRLQSALLEMSLTDLQIIVRRFAKGETCNKIAKDLEIHTSTVCRRVQRLIKFLRKRVH